MPPPMPPPRAAALEELSEGGEVDVEDSITGSADVVVAAKDVEREVEELEVEVMEVLDELDTTSASVRLM